MGSKTLRDGSSGERLGAMGLRGSWGMGKLGKASSEFPEELRRPCVCAPSVRGQPLVDVESMVLGHEGGRGFVLDLEKVCNAKAEHVACKVPSCLYAAA